MSRLPILLLAALVAVACSRQEEVPEARDPEPPKVEAVAVRWEDRKDDGTGVLFVTLTDNSDHKVSEDALNHWISADRQSVFYTVRHGKSGYEREGEALYEFVVATQESRMLFEHDLMIFAVYEAKSKSGRRALIVDMGDGGRGAPDLAIVDPERGRVYTAELARFKPDPHTPVQGPSVTIERFTGEAIDSHDFGQWPVDRTETIELDTVLANEASRETPNPIPEGQ